MYIVALALAASAILLICTMYYVRCTSTMRVYIFIERDRGQERAVHSRVERVRDTHARIHMCVMRTMYDVRCTMYLYLVQGTRYDVHRTVDYVHRSASSRELLYLYE